MSFKRLLIFVLIIFLLGLLSVYYPKMTNEFIKKVEYENEKCFVNRIIDGDTLVCNNETIRLLGIDTPERGEEYYQEAKDFLKQVEGKGVEILHDWDDLGKYKRKFRYVFYEGRFINIEIVQEGFGKAFMIENLKYEDKFINAENYAKNNCLKIWEKDC